MKLRRFKVAMVAFLVFALIFPSNIFAKEELFTAQICNIHLDTKGVEEAELLTSPRYRSSVGEVITANEEIVFPVQMNKVEDAIYAFIGALKKYRINPGEFAVGGLNISRVKAVVKNKSGDEIAGHAYVYYPEDRDIYLYDTSLYDISSTSILGTVLHEIGHFVDSKYFTDEDRESYMKLRGLYGSWNDPYVSWEVNPIEVFAEDFKILLGNSIGQKLKSHSDYKGMDASLAQQFKDLVVSAMKRGQSEYQADPYQRLIELGLIADSVYFSCDQNERDSLLSSDLTSKELFYILYRYVLRSGINAEERDNFLHNVKILSGESSVAIDDEPVSMREAQHILNWFAPFLVKHEKARYSDLIFRFDDSASSNLISHKAFYDLLQKALERDSDEVSKVTSSYSSLYFQDVKDGSLRKKLNFLANREIIQFGELYRPQDSLKREEAVVMAIQMLGVGEIAPYMKPIYHRFEDVSKNHWASAYIFLAKSYGLISSDKKTFGLRSSITYEEFSKILKRTNMFDADVFKDNRFSHDKQLNRSDAANLLYALFEEWP